MVIGLTVLIACLWIVSSMVMRDYHETIEHQRDIIEGLYEELRERRSEDEADAWKWN